MKWIERTIWIVLVLAMGLGFAAYYAHSHLLEDGITTTQWGHVMTAARIKRDLDSGDLEAATKSNDEFLQREYDTLRRMHEWGEFEMQDRQLEKLVIIGREVGIETVEQDFPL